MLSYIAEMLYQIFITPSCMRTVVQYNYNLKSKTYQVLSAVHGILCFVQPAYAG